MRRRINRTRQRSEFGGELAVVVAGEALRPRLVALFRARGFDVAVPPTPLDAVQLVLAQADRVGVVALSPGVTWAAGLDEFLADEYPAIRRVTIASTVSPRSRIPHRPRARARGTRPPRFAAARPFETAA